MFPLFRSLISFWRLYKSIVIAPQRTYICIIVRWLFWIFFPLLLFTQISYSCSSLFFSWFDTKVFDEFDHMQIFLKNLSILYIFLSSKLVIIFSIVVSSSWKQGALGVGNQWNNFWGTNVFHTIIILFSWNHSRYIFVVVGGVWSWLPIGHTGFVERHEVNLAWGSSFGWRKEDFVIAFT